MQGAEFGCKALISSSQRTCFLKAHPRNCSVLLASPSQGRNGAAASRQEVSPLSQLGFLAVMGNSPMAMGLQHMRDHGFSQMNLATEQHSKYLPAAAQGRAKILISYLQY